MTTIRSEIQNQAEGTLLQYAIFRWENAVILGLTIMLTFLWPIYSSMKDSENNSEVLLRAFQEQFDPSQIQDPNLRKDVESALEYQRRIESEVHQQKAGLMQDRLADSAGQISEWLSNVYQLAQRLDTYRRDDLLDRERSSLPGEIKELEQQRAREHNPDVLEQQSISALATIYSQIRLIDAQDIASGRAERLQSDIQEQVARLNDLVSSVSEVYNYN